MIDWYGAIENTQRNAAAVSTGHTPKLSRLKIGTAIKNGTVRDCYLFICTLFIVDNH